MVMWITVDPTHRKVRDEWGTRTARSPKPELKTESEPDSFSSC